MNSPLAPQANTHGRRTGQMVTVSAILSAAALFGPLSTGAYASTGLTNQSEVQAVTPLSASKAPCIVTGYTPHASDQMAARGITSDKVENVVYTYCSQATRRKSNNTWQYRGGGILVSANDNGYVVTVVKT